ncbi:MAG: polyprenyl synthetase family protein [Methanobacteriota archaeon]
MLPSVSPAIALEKVLEEYAGLVNVELERHLSHARSEMRTWLRASLARSGRRLRPSMAVLAPMRHVIEAGGKRIRPTLCLLACEAVGGDRKHALPTAAGIELLHTFTLVHDDVMDNAEIRRNRPTVGSLWGDPVAITVGDGLFALSYRAMAASTEEGADPLQVLRVLALASEVSLHLAEGQMLDLALAKSPTATIEEYMAMVRAKTGILLEFSLEAGALLGGAGRSDAEAFGRFGAPLGVAFQIRDDVLDVTADEATLGKPVGGDIRTGKRTLLVAHALAHSSRADRLLAILDRPEDETTPADVAEAIRILHDAGSIEHATRVAEDELGKAEKHLANLPDAPGTDAVDTLRSIAGFIATRRK